MAKTYKDAGVNIDAGEETVRRIGKAVKATHTGAVLNDIGAFGAMYDASFSGYKEPVLVSSIDGVGTKLKIAALAERYHTVGQDLVNHCVNDILTAGAKPLYFLDYYATAALDPGIGEQVITGFAAACKENGCALIGGETAEMPGVYNPPDFDLAGAITGVVEKANILGPERVQAGDALIGLRSSGLHTNGYSLARAVLLERFELDIHIPELDATLADALLAVHRSYYPVLAPYLTNPDLHAISHITGGGLEGNTNRVLPDGLKLNVDYSAWEVPALFKLIQETGDVPTDDMRRTFNMGIGLVLIVSDPASDRFADALTQAGEEPVVIGKIASE